MIGETIGNFKIVSRLGRGGMGEVWLAEQTSIGTKVAIKLLNAAVSEDTEHVQRFFNEARAVSRIQHAGIVKIFDVGHHGGHAYLVMEFLDGESLAQRIAQAKRLPLADLCEIGRQVASVLDATHSAGITHRDLKPDNIFVVPDRELARGYRVKILDFGIAKLTGTLAVVSPRTTGTMGTPAYMAPEQWGDASKVDWRADLYSLGCVTFEMATGRPPFIVSNIAEACAKHLHDPPPHVRELAADAPASLDGLVDRLLAKSPAARAESMREVERAFSAIAGNQPVAFAETLASMQTSAAPLPITPPQGNRPLTHPGRVSTSVMPTSPDTRRPRTALPLLAKLVLGVV
ncbi:MAG TPA: serine/threonine-protein kinase, partial [Kofleriaceae bacterium]|nr:serine/threonine-protein kinase [Kofleriaceae bacterium]